MRRFLPLLILALSCQGSARTFSDLDPRTPQSTQRVWPKVRPPTPQAWFVMSFADVPTVRWPDFFWPYTLIVADISSSAADLASMRTVGPGVTFLASTNAQSIPQIYTFSNSFNNGLKAAWDSTHFCIYELDSSKVMRVEGVMQWCPRQASVDSLVRVIADSAYGKVSWDGLFVDESELAYPTFKKNILGSTNFDCDGDGVADSKAKLDAQYAQWRPYLAQRLRVISGAKPIIANSAGPLGDPSLNGITIENVGDGVHSDSTAAIAALEAQRAVGRSPFIGVVWMRNPIEIPSCLTVVNRVPGVYYGIHSGDGLP